jgi:hypothetical protein
VAHETQKIGMLGMRGDDRRRVRLRRALCRGRDTRALKAVVANPGKSDRALAMECGVGRTTIQRARKSGGPHEPPERVGKDGKTYKPRVGGSADEGQRQFTALVLRLLLMIQGQEPQRYAVTRVSPDDLRSVGRFVSKVAAAKVASPVGKKVATG